MIYYIVITGYILSESILLSLLQANHAWGTEWESRSKVESVTISQHQISTGTFSNSGREKSTEYCTTLRYKLQLMTPPSPSLKEEQGRYPLLQADPVLAAFPQPRGY